LGENRTIFFFNARGLFFVWTYPSGNGYGLLKDLKGEFGRQKRLNWALLKTKKSLLNGQIRHSPTFSFI
jgi:hypothetical protein